MIYLACFVKKREFYDLQDVIGVSLKISVIRYNSNQEEKCAFLYL